MIDPRILQFVVGSGRSWWVLQYKDDTFRYEWQEHPGGNRILLPESSLSAISEWENTDKKGVVKAMLICPNGQIGGFNEPAQLFQFKKGHVSINTTDVWCDAHILGAVTDDNGSCDYISYEPLSNRLVSGSDNVNDFKYQNIGRLDPSIIAICR